MQPAIWSSQLIAAWSLKVDINWPRFILSMFLLAALIFAAAWAYQSTDSPKKKDKGK